VIDTNYLELTWSRRDLKNPEISKEQDDCDPEKKLLSKEIKRSQFEKKMIVLILVLSVSSWYLVG
jgi:hypothetical protein